MFNHEAPQSTKHGLKNENEAERIESFAAFVLNHEITKISLFQLNPPPPHPPFSPLLLQPDQYNLISFQSRSL